MAMHSNTEAEEKHSNTEAEEKHSNTEAEEKHSNTEAEEKEWQDYANCLGVDPDLFFPERGASTREAKEVCRGCVVRDECLEYALQNGEKFGIWGGMSERERRRIRRRRALARAAEASQAGGVTV